MQPEGIHHVTAITGDAPGNVEFYAGLMGLRLVKKTVNQDDPSAYHLFYADERGSPGSDLTFFEYPGVEPGRSGTGMIYRVIWRVSSEDALDFWQERLGGAGVEAERAGRGSERRAGSLRFADPEGLDLELVVSGSQDEPLVAYAPDVPPELALQGFEGVRAHGTGSAASRDLLERSLGFRSRGERCFEVRGERRGAFYIQDGPAERGRQGAGTVHHLAFAARMDEHEAWRERVLEAGARPTPVIDRFYFRSVYFREPDGVLFELATIGPGFAVDEPEAELGLRLSLPPEYERLRWQLERTLTSLPDPRAAGS